MASTTKRSQKQIEADLRRIKEAAKTAISIVDIARTTGLSRQQINTTLSKHSIVSRRIMEQLKNNKTLLEAHTAKDITSVPQTLANDEMQAVTAKEVDIPETKPAKEVAVEEAVNIPKDKVKQYVIDASATATEHLPDRLANILASNYKIVLTSISIAEIARIQKVPGITGRDARYILSLAAKSPQTFETVLINETIGEPDDCIIQYCKEHKDNIILLTGDKEMALKARLYGIEVEFREKDPIYHAEQQARHRNKSVPFGQPVLPSTSLSKTPSTASKPVIDKKATAPTVVKSIQEDNWDPLDKQSTALGMKKNDYDELIIDNFHTPTRSIEIFSRGTMQSPTGPYKLHVGDKILVASLEKDEILFKVYQIISLSSRDNHMCLLKKSFPRNTKHFYLSDGDYRTFLYAFKKRHNL